jgi:hypothetical protein
MVKKKEIKKKLEELRVPEPPRMVSYFPPQRVVVGFNNLTWPLQILVIFGWVIVALVVINFILLLAILMLGGA